MPVKPPAKTPGPGRPQQPEFNERVLDKDYDPQPPAAVQHSARMAEHLSKVWHHASEACVSLLGFCIGRYPQHRKKLKMARKAVRVLREPDNEDD